MKLFREELERRQERNRNVRYGGWSGLLLKILIVILVIYFATQFSGQSVENMLWFMSGGKTAQERTTK